MIRLEIPQRGLIELHHAVFDINGTLAVDGIPIPGVVSLLKALAEHLSLHALTAGTHGNLTELEQALGLPLHIITSAGFQPNEEEGVSRLQEHGVVNWPKADRRATSWSR